MRSVVDAEAPAIPPSISDLVTANWLHDRGATSLVEVDTHRPQVR
jgi:hypothetical protein